MCEILNPILWHTLASMTSSKLSAVLWSAFERRRRLLSIGAFCFALGLLILGPAVGFAAEGVISCREPSMEANGVVVVRCHLEAGVAGGAWRAVTAGQGRVCGSLAVASTLPDGPSARCGVVGEEVWFWQRLAAPERGALRYRSWARGGAWRVEGSELLPDTLVAGGGVGQWGPLGWRGDDGLRFAS